jgi:hypothetical protein
MIAIIILVITAVIIAIVAMKACKEACYHAIPGSKASFAKWLKFVILCDRRGVWCVYGLNRTNMALTGMFTMLSAVLLHSGFFIAGIMKAHGTEVQGMGWILIALYMMGTLGCIAYSLGFGSHVMNRPNK